MATVKVVLRKKVNKDGTYPLALRITKDRKTSFIHLGYHLHENEWIDDEQRVKSSHPNSKRLNNFILAKKAEASDKALESETQKNEVSTRAIKQKIKPKGGATFFAQAHIYLKNLEKTGNYNCFIAEKSRVKIFQLFISGRDITKADKPTGKKDVAETGLSDIAFSDITMGLLARFKVELASKRKSSDRTIANYLVMIRSVFSQAIRDGVTEEKHYPFGKGKTSIEFPDSTKVGISPDDVIKLETVDLPIFSHDHARNIWLVSYYFAGMRVSDVLRLRWSDFKEMRLHYTMGKNNKAGSLKTPEKAFAILNKYLSDKENKNDLIFPDLKILADLNDEFEVKRKIAQAVNRYNKTLNKFVLPAAEIESKVTMHISRHTFATLAGDKIPIQMLQKLYRHSDIKTTIGYQANFIYKDADEALDAVLGV
ncbi:site-specific integrase [Flavobacterium sp.]|uniref:site-specific integrase n=1 Tax=Flavobacterium sp. TaxID=239 RepID=UPI0026164048|nr:site-specific integrase [Flavobacterium sp.]